MEVKIICKYCDFKWETTIFNDQDVNSMICRRCRSSDFNIKELTKSKIDTYIGCPPFEGDIDDMVKKLQKALDADWQKSVEYL